MARTAVSRQLQSANPVFELSSVGAVEITGGSSGRVRCSRVESGGSPERHHRADLPQSGPICSSERADLLLRVPRPAPTDNFSHQLAAAAAADVVTRLTGAVCHRQRPDLAGNVLHRAAALIKDERRRRNFAV